MHDALVALLHLGAIFGTEKFDIVSPDHLLERAGEDRKHRLIDKLIEPRAILNKHRIADAVDDGAKHLLIQSQSHDADPARCATPAKNYDYRS